MTTITSGSHADEPDDGREKDIEDEESLCWSERRKEENRVGFSVGFPVLTNHDCFLKSCCASINAPILSIPSQVQGYSV